MRDDDDDEVMRKVMRNDDAVMRKVMRDDDQEKDHRWKRNPCVEGRTFFYKRTAARTYINKFV